MRSILVTLFFLVMIIFLIPTFSLLSHDENAYRRSIEAIKLFRKATENVVSILEDKKIVECEPNEYLQSCLDNNIAEIIYLKSGTYQISPFHLNNNQKLVISSNTTLTLSDDIVMPYKDGYVMEIMGTKEEPVEDVTLILNGTIDGNKSVHPYER